MLESLSRLPTEWRYATRKACIDLRAMNFDYSVGYISGAKLDIGGPETGSTRSCGDRSKTLSFT